MATIKERLTELIEKKEKFEEQLNQRDPITGEVFANTLEGECVQMNSDVWFEGEIKKISEITEA